MQKQDTAIAIDIHGVDDEATGEKITAKLAARGIESKYEPFEDAIHVWLEYTEQLEDVQTVLEG